MLNFKSSVSRDWNRYNIIIKAENESEARSKLHKEGYSILSLQEVSDVNLTWKKFLFEAIISWERKKWTIIWSDIFKTYLKLVEELKYQIVSIYPEEYKDNEIEKDKIITRLESQFLIYKSSKDKEESKEKKIKDKEDGEEKTSSNQLYMEKKLNWYYDNLNLVLVKIDNLLSSKHNEDISAERREKLELIRISLIKVKTSTNIARIKEVWEKALLKLWEIELELYEKYKDWDIKSELKNTNSLLKNLWSRESFIEKDRDIKYQTKRLISWISDYFKDTSLKKWKKIEKIVDKTSDDYIKTMLLINKYEKKLKEINFEILKKAYYPLLWKNKKEEYELLNIKKSVFEQNIKLLNAKIKWLPFSYTKLKKGYNFIEWHVLRLLKFLNKSLYYSILLCLSSFVIFLISNYYLGFDFDLSKYSILYFIIIQSLFILIFTIRWIFSMIVSFAIFIFMVIFLLVNF